MGAWQTKPTLEGVRTNGEPEGWRSTVEPKGWRLKVRLDTGKSMAKLGLQETKVVPEGLGSLVEPE